MTNLTMNIGSFATYATRTIEAIHQAMKDNNGFWNVELGGHKDQCEALGLTMNGHVVALRKSGYGYCLSKLLFANEKDIEDIKARHISYDPEYKIISRPGIVGNVIHFTQDWEKTIADYNRDCSLYGSQEAEIVAYIVIAD